MELWEREKEFLLAIRQKVLSELSRRTGTDLQNLHHSDWQYLVLNMVSNYKKFLKDDFSFASRDGLSVELIRATGAAHVCLCLVGKSDLADLTLLEWKRLAIAVTESWDNKSLHTDIKNCHRPAWEDGDPE
jgi:hypothetical protein